jgi:hypothetical protein
MYASITCSTSSRLKSEEVEAGMEAEEEEDLGTRGRGRGRARGAQQKPGLQGASHNPSREKVVLLVDLRGEGAEEGADVVAGEHNDEPTIS